MEYELNFREVTYALSEALDLVGIDDLYHGKRVAYMAAECAIAGEYDENLVTELIYIGMLHDCGVSTTDTHMHLVTQLEWKNEQAHCERGYLLLEKAALFEPFAKPVLYHHTHWKDLKNLDIDEGLKKKANLIYLVDRVDALRSQLKKMPFNEMKEEISQIISRNQETLFSPELCELFFKASARDSFWFYLANDALEKYLSEWVAKGKIEYVAFDKLREIALMFANIVDAKSPFTAEHSFGVTSLSLFLGERIGLEPHSMQIVELAALLHDLGKLRVEDDVLNKPGPLDISEKLALNRHGFDSDMILRKINGFKEVAHLASLHHETLDGKGYPYSISADKIPMEARVIAVADIFQALIQNRPYRKALSAEEAFEIIDEMSEAGKVDTHLVSLLKDNLSEAYIRASSPRSY